MINTSINTLAVNNITQLNLVPLNPILFLMKTLKMYYFSELMILEMYKIIEFMEEDRLKVLEDVENVIWLN